MATLTTSLLLLFGTATCVKGAAAHLSALDARQVSTKDVSIAGGSLTPWNISSEDWAQHMAQPDLMGSWPIRGFNISSAEYQAADLDWTITMSVQREIPASVVGSDVEDRSFAGVMYRLEPPDELIEPILARIDDDDADLDDENMFSILNESWEVCQTTYGFTLEANRTAVEDDDGSCSTVFSEACRRAIEREETVTYTDVDGIKGFCRIRKMPEECDFDGSGGLLPAAAEYGRWEDELGEDEAKDIDWLRGSELMSVASSYTDSSSAGENVKRATKHVDFIIVTFAFKESESDDGVEARLSSRLVCPKALKEASEVDREGNDGGNDGGNDDGDGEDDDGSSSALMPSVMFVCAGWATVMGILNMM